jgi:hypothetical protein
MDARGMHHALREQLLVHATLNGCSAYRGKSFRGGEHNLAAKILVTDEVHLTRTAVALME